MEKIPKYEIDSDVPLDEDEDYELAEAVKAYEGGNCAGRSTTKGKRAR